MRYRGAADSACTSICVCVYMDAADCWRRWDDRVYCDICMYRYNVYALLYIHIGIWETLINMCIRPAGAAAAAASTAGIGAVSHSRHVLLVIFVLFNKKTIKSRHIYNRGTTAVGGIVRPARRARQNNRIIIFPCRYIIIVASANERVRRADAAADRDRRPSEKERHRRRRW